VPTRTPLRLPVVLAWSTLCTAGVLHAASCGGQATLSESPGCAPDAQPDCRTAMPDGPRVPDSPGGPDVGEPDSPVI
jgi:hypothetical protein